MIGMSALRQIRRVTNAVYFCVSLHMWFSVSVMVISFKMARLLSIAETETRAYGFAPPRILAPSLRMLRAYRFISPFSLVSAVITLSASPTALVWMMNASVVSTGYDAGI